MKRAAKKVRAVWQSSVKRDGRFVHLFVPYDGKIWLPDKFHGGDKVRVIVKLLERKEQG
jgi:hypothetical protein